MKEEFTFTGDTKTDTGLVFDSLKEISTKADYGVFFRRNKEIQLALRKYYHRDCAQEIVADAFGVVDKDGNSLLSVAYEQKNTAVVNIITSFVLAHGIEKHSLYTPLTSPKLLMLQRKNGSLGDFAKNLVSIFNQLLNSKNQEESSRLVSCYTFVALPRDIQNAADRPTEHKSEIQPTFKAKVKRRIINLSKPLSGYLSPLVSLSRSFM